MPSRSIDCGGGETVEGDTQRAHISTGPCVLQAASVDGIVDRAFEDYATACLTSSSRVQFSFIIAELVTKFTQFTSLP